MILMIVLAANNAAAQTSCPQVKSKDLQKKYSDAVNLMQSNKELGVKYMIDIAKALPDYYQATLEIGNYYLDKMRDAQIRFQQKVAEGYADDAVKYLTLSYNSCPNYDSARAAFLLGESLYLRRKYEDAGIYLDAFVKSPNAAQSCLPLARKRIAMISDYNELMAHPIKFDPKMLRNVSTRDDEYLPLISHDGSILLYTHRVAKRNGTSTEELMQSSLISCDSLGELFSQGYRMTNPFNMGKLQGGASLTIDNHILYITICAQDNCDIYYSKFVDGKWQPLIKLPNTVNTDYFDGQPSVDATGNVLYFASNRPGGFGGYDIYKIERKSVDSLWSAPINLGPSINTEFDEKTPYIHCDGKTLYFSSNGHGGVGGFDIFCAKLDNNNFFSKPKNIGYPLNTENDEVAYIVSADGRRIYFSAKLLSGVGGWDIYCADLIPDASPSQVLLIKGKVTDEKGNPVPNVDVNLTSLKTYESSHNITDPKTGEYAVSSAVNEDEDFMLTVKKKGYFYNVKFITPESGNYVPPTEENVTLDHIKTGVPIQLENVNFAFNSSRLTEHSTAYLQQLAMFLEEYPLYNVELLGHTDAVGNEEDNMQLSERRCRTVYNYLVMSGIPAKRLSYKAFGKSSPMATNNTSKGRALNRRVEMILTEIK